MKMLLRSPRATLALVSALTLAACSGDERSAYARATSAPAGVTIVDPVTLPYQPVDVVAAGSVGGTVTFSGEAPRDTAIVVSRDERVCGNTLRHIVVQTQEDRVEGALVWLADIRRGRPLPLSRRFELVQTRCTFGPILQPVLAGGALNVRTHDPILAEIVVLDTRTRDTMAVLPFSSAGSLIPLDTQLRQPAMLQIRSVTHPWMEAWVAVLDHPYFAMTDRAGQFLLEQVPPGRYQVKAWHPRFGMATGNVSVAAGGASQLDLRFENASGDSTAVAAERSARGPLPEMTARGAASAPGRQPSP